MFKNIVLSFAILFVTPLAVWAQTPTNVPHMQQAQAELIKAEQLALTDAGRKDLQKRLSRAVVRVFAQQKKAHHLVENNTYFDGAAVAISPENILEILPQNDVQELTETQPNKTQTRRSFFGREQYQASSPFAKKTPPKKQFKSSKQYYLTTADWLTHSESFQIEIQSKRIDAKLEYRDEAQNVAVLSSEPSEFLLPVEIHNPELPIPLLAFAILHPHSMYESFTQHTIQVPELHLYGTSTLTARNGYPLFNVLGQLTGLCVGPRESKKVSQIVHPGLIDRALHPKKYDRVKIEKVDVTTEK